MFKGLAAFCQMIINAIAAVLNVICQAFPPSPFTIISHTGFGDLIAKINYFLPIYEFVTVAETWLVAVGFYYVIALVARWVKAIE